jgi:uncharacterized membrane protein YqjE
MNQAPAINAVPDGTTLAPEAVDISPMDALRRLRSVSGDLAAQLGLHGQLAKVEWADEKLRLGRLLKAALLGVAFLVSTCIFGGVLLLTLGWRGGFLIPAAIVLVVLYAGGTLLAWLKVRALLALSVHSFAASRAEFAADIAMIRSRL